MEHYYKFKYYVNARHSVDLGMGESGIHPHTWEIVIYIKVNSSTMINFSSIDKYLDNYFEDFEGKYLNELDSFKSLETTMENIGKVVFEQLKRFLIDRDMNLQQLEISENPTRTYIIKENE